MALDYVDIFHSHRTIPRRRWETKGVPAHLHRQGKALHVGIFRYPPELAREAAAMLAEERLPHLIHQPRYSMLDRRIEDGSARSFGWVRGRMHRLLPLAQGMVTSTYLDGAPEDAGSARGGSLDRNMLSAANFQRIRALNAIAERRGQTLTQMAIAWVLHNPRMTSALIGVRTVAQLDNSLEAVRRLDFLSHELAEINGLQRSSEVD